MRIEIDTDRCIGAARCVQHAPGVFTQDDDGVVELLPVSGELEDAPLIQEAVIACPVQAITVEQP